MHAITSRYQTPTQSPFSTGAGVQHNTAKRMHRWLDTWKEREKERRQGRKVERGDMLKGKSLGIAAVRLGNCPIIPHLLFLPYLAIPANCGPSSAKQMYGARP